MQITCPFGTSPRTHHTRLDFSGRVINQTQRLPDYTQHTRDIHPDPAGFRTHNTSKPASADQRLRPRCHWDRLKK